jgi:uncharacterized protein YjbI with pentapeptide repeats
MHKGLVYKTISKKRIADLNSGELPEEAVFEALKSGEFNHACCEDFRLTSWGTKNIHVKNFSWKRGKFRGEFTNCIFSDGEIDEVDFWDSDFKDVTFRNVSFTEGEINSFYSDRYMFELDNVIFENCTFYRFTIGQALNSNIYLKNCKMMKSSFYLKSSCISFYRCSTENKKSYGAIFIGMIEPKIAEPIKIQECLFFGLELVGNKIDILKISAKDVDLSLSWELVIKDLKIYCNYIQLSTRCETPQNVKEMQNRYSNGLPPPRRLDNLEIICSNGGVFGLFGFKINTLKICMTEERPESGSAICYSHVNHVEMIGVKTDDMLLSESTISKARFKSCYFNDLEFSDCNIADLGLNSVKVARKFVLKNTKIGHLSLGRVSLDKKANWESESSVVALLDKLESEQQDIKNVSGQVLAGYFDRADVGLSK